MEAPADRAGAPWSTRSPDRARPCPARFMAIQAIIGFRPAFMAMGIRMVPTRAVAGVGQKKEAQMYITTAMTTKATVGLLITRAAGAIIILSAPMASMALSMATISAMISIMSNRSAPATIMPLNTA